MLFMKRLYFVLPSFGDDFNADQLYIIFISVLATQNSYLMISFLMKNRLSGNIPKAFDTQN